MQPEPIFFFHPLRSFFFLSKPEIPDRYPKRIDFVFHQFFEGGRDGPFERRAIFNLATTLFFHVRIPHVLLTLLEAISLVSTCFSHSFGTSTQPNLSVYSTVLPSEREGIVVAWSQFLLAWWTSNG